MRARACACVNHSLFWPDLLVYRGQGHFSDLLSCPSQPQCSFYSPQRDWEALLGFLVVSSRPLFSIYNKAIEKLRLLQMIHLSLTCTRSSNMPAAIMPSPASRYEGITWRQITLEDSLLGTWSLNFCIFSRELLGLGVIPGLHSSCLCTLEPECCQPRDPDTVCLCQPALSHSADPRDLTHGYQVFILFTDDNLWSYTAQLCIDQIILVSATHRWLYY